MVQGWVGTRGAQEEGGGTRSGVISEAHNLNNVEAELRGDGFYYEFNPCSETGYAHTRTCMVWMCMLVSFPAGRVSDITPQHDLQGRFPRVRATWTKIYQGPTTVSDVDRE